MTKRACFFDSVHLQSNDNNERKASGAKDGKHGIFKMKSYYVYFQMNCLMIAGICPYHVLLIIFRR